MSKSTMKFIAKLAEKLPAQQYQTRFKHRLRGDELHGSAEYINETGDRMSHYVVPVATKNDVNHKRRMKRAYKTNGVQGVVNYVLKRTKTEYQEEVKSFILTHLQ